ncbi:MAG TPA: protein-tyrosine kinase [Dysgonomonas sp.]|nr:protein-tyrosine kinase [Dysgonomonas sp.]
MKRETITIENGIVSVPASAEIWMTQHEITDLFGCFVSKVNSNIRSILKSGVLRETEVCRIYYYQNGNFVEVYSLEIIIALSFRIGSKNAEIFRKWLIRKPTKPEIPEMLIRAIKNPTLN